MQFVEKGIFALLVWNHCWSHVYFDRTTEKTHAQHIQTKDWAINFDSCSHSALHCKVNQHRTNTPFSYTVRCIPKTQKGPLQIQVTAFQRYKIYFKKPLSLPYGNHLLSSIITRPHRTRFSGACICYLTSYFQKTVLFTFLPKSESRLSGLSPSAVT